MATSDRDPERLRVLLSDYSAAMASIIERWEARSTKFIGDEFTALWG